ncbi:MAG: hypothetical protein JST54_06910 [Deltaproteobacteria bacterium]|nr:hypothetical protein [Deltaproteobacteria bacterium]
MAKPEEGYYGPVRIIAGDHQGKLGYLDDYDLDDQDHECGVVYLEGEEPSVGDYVLIPAEQLEQPDTEVEAGELEERIWDAAERKGKRG